MKRPSIALRFLTPKKLKHAILFNKDGKVTQFFISRRLKYYCRFIKAKKIYLNAAYIVKLVPEWGVRQKSVR